MAILAHATSTSQSLPQRFCTLSQYSGPSLARHKFSPEHCTQERHGIAGVAAKDSRGAALRERSDTRHVTHLGVTQHLFERVSESVDKSRANVWADAERVFMDGLQNNDVISVPTCVFTLSTLGRLAIDHLPSFFSPLYHLLPPCCAKLEPQGKLQLAAPLPGDGLQRCLHRSSCPHKHMPKHRACPSTAHARTHLLCCGCQQHRDALLSGCSLALAQGRVARVILVLACERWERGCGRRKARERGGEVRGQMRKMRQFATHNLSTAPSSHLHTSTLSCLAKATSPLSKAPFTRLPPRPAGGTVP